MQTREHLRQSAAQQEHARADQARHETRVAELQSAQAALERQVNRLTESLAGETKHREDADRQVSELGQHRRDLETQLAKQLEAESKLQTEMAALRQQLQTEQESARAELARSELRIKDLQTAQVVAEQQSANLTQALAEGKKLREAADQQVSELGRQRRDLEAQLAENRETQSKLQEELAALRQRLQTEQESARAEQAKSELRIKDLQTAQAVAEQQSATLTQSLAGEKKLREDADHKLEESGRRYQQLEAVLAEKQQTEGTLQRELDEVRRQCDAHRIEVLAEQATVKARTAELASVQSLVEEKSRQLLRLAEKIAGLEQTTAELETQAVAARDLARAQESAIQSLKTQVQEQQSGRDRLASTLEAEIAGRRREQSQIAALEQQVAGLTGELSGKIAEQQCLRQRESELERQVRQQADQLADSAAAAAVRESELRKLRSTVDDLQIVESALCGKVRELTAQQDAAVRRIQELDEQSRAAERARLSRDQEVAALHYAVLDAARTGARVGNERRQMDCDAAEGWRRLLSALLDTPLSLTQRGLISEIAGAMDGWRQARSRSTPGVEFQVESPDLCAEEFDCAEVIEGAFESVRSRAAETGTMIQTTLAQPVPVRAQGNARHIHQLITLLAAALPEVGAAEKLELKVAFVSRQNDAAELIISMLLTPTTSAETLCLRLKTFTKFSRAVRTDSGGGGLALASAWQLALALGGRPGYEATQGGEVLVQIPLPLFPSRSASAKQEAPQAGDAGVARSGQPSEPSPAALSEKG